VRHGERLLDVDVLAGHQRGQCNLRVLVIGKTDRHGVDVLPLEQLVIILIDGHVGARPVLLGVERADPLLPELGATHVEIAHCQHLGEVRAGDAGEVMRLPDTSASDVADANAIARRSCAEEPRGDVHRRGEDADGEGALLDELATRDAGGLVLGVGHEILRCEGRLSGHCCRPLSVGLTK
jgi:hypothetical protein